MVRLLQLQQSKWAARRSNPRILLKDWWPEIPLNGNIIHTRQDGNTFQKMASYKSGCTSHPKLPKLNKFQHSCVRT
jgi:hypothetical protein